MRRRILIGSVTVTAMGLILLSLTVTVLERSGRLERTMGQLERTTAVVEDLLGSGGTEVVGALDSVGPQRTTLVDPEGVVVAGASLPFSFERIEAAGEGEIGADGGSTEVPTDEGDVVVAVRALGGAGEVSGGAVVAWIPVADIPRDGPRLTTVAWAVSFVALVVLALVTTVIVDRTLRPASFAVVQQGRFVDDAGRAIHRPLDEVRKGLERSLVALRPAGGVHSSIAALDRAVGAVDDLLTLLRLDALGASGRPVDRRLMRLDLVAASEVPDGVGFSSAGPSEIVADEPLVRRAVGHMIANAQIHGIGPVEVTVVGGAVTVLDRGPGFGENAHQVFGRFRSSEGSPGLGLGLALVAAVARLHGGRVSAENRPDGGGKVVLAFDTARA